MRLVLIRVSIIFIIVCAFVLIDGVLLGTDDHMLILPVFTHFKCAICHSDGSPTPGNEDLNLFGVDFLDNGMKWNQTLAEKDSDHDGFPNGQELGDELGDGVPEVQVERSNPGDPDNYPSSIDETTWGILKSIFNDKSSRRRL